MNTDQSELLTFIGGFLLFLGGAAGIGLFIQVVLDEYREVNGSILATLFIACGAAGVTINSGTLPFAGWFLLILGVLSGLVLLIKAFANVAHDSNGAVLFVLFLFCTAVGYFLASGKSLNT